ncbi:hypothetical protein ACFS7Z_15130 [Pontibacter toksunensis]|uniref:YhhN-like protein n=1 Tax=Pontibacter toksunensis TaxID=1332631 RepID=A0ABW6BXL9_9BACT
MGAIVNIATFSVLIPLLAGLIRFKRGGQVSYILFGYVVVSALVDAGGLITASKGINNNWMSHVFVPLEYLFFSSVYALAVPSERWKKAVYVSFWLFLGFCVLNVFLWEPLDKFNSKARVLESALLIAMVLLYFYSKLKQREEQNFLTEPLFLFSSAILLYFSGTVVIFSFLEALMQESMELARSFMNVMRVLLIMLNVVIAIVLLKDKK